MNISHLNGHNFFTGAATTAPSVGFGDPMATLLGYMTQHRQQPGTLILFQDGNPLFKERLLFNVQQALSYCGVNASELTASSFRLEQPQQ